MRLLAALLASCLIFSAVGRCQDSQPVQAPAITLKGLNGRIIRLSDFKGKVVLLNFWATWCSPCAAEVPELVKWQAKYKKQGFQIIGITYPPTNKIGVQRFVRRMKINYPILLGSKETKNLFDSSETLPVSIIVDRKGRIAGRIDGIIFADEFDVKVKPLFK